ARKGADRLPLDYWGTEEMTAKLRAALGVADDEALWKALDIDRAHYTWPDLHDPLAGHRNGADVWGMTHRRIEYAHGAGAYDEIAVAPLETLETVRDIEAYAWPDPTWWTCEHVAERAQARSAWPVFGGSYEPFYLYTQMRGQERSMEDLADNGAFLEAALERIFAIHYDLVERTLVAGRGAIDFIYIAEDLGSQDSLLMSPATFRKFLKPRMKQMIALVHKHGALAFHHDDGAIAALIPDLLEVGIDILNPVQWRCAGMDRARLKRDFGSRVAFHGAMDNQHTLPFGTVEDVRREVRENAAILGAGGGYILAPCHNLQPITPVENVLAMYDEARKL
ncbi:MAG: uroporphyrinogen decarboxylase family protein, partial [bacterium]